MTEIKMLFQNGIFQILPSQQIRTIPWQTLRLWMHYKGVYCVPSQELIDFLIDENLQNAIEIGCGYGYLGRSLAIPITDAMIQNKPEVQLVYALSQQPVIEYPSDVECLEALDAIAKYQPSVVIGAWITRWIDPLLPPPEGGGSIYGVKEQEVIARTKRYIHIGSKAIHGYKLTYQRPPDRIINADWLISRSVRNDDVIYIWEN